MTTAVLSKESARYEQFYKIFGGDTAPLTSIIPVKVEMRNAVQFFYRVDLEELSEEQINRLAEFAGEKETLTTAEARLKMETTGFYLLGDDLTVYSNEHARLSTFDDLFDDMEEIEGIEAL